MCGSRPHHLYLLLPPEATVTTAPVTIASQTGSRRKRWCGRLLYRLVARRRFAAFQYQPAYFALFAEQGDQLAPNCGPNGHSGTLRKLWPAWLPSGPLEKYSGNAKFPYQVDRII